VIKVLFKIKKLIYCLLVKVYRKALRFSVGGAIEHEKLLKSLNIETIVDIGANKGQFALVSRYCFPGAKIVSFEPLSAPAKIFNQVFKDDRDTVLHNVAIGPKEEETIIHISQSDDSSSLLPISDLQEEVFPGTSEASTATVTVAPLGIFLSKADIKSPALLKLDVQGFELEALMGCESLLASFDSIYCECSFVELYSGQKMAPDIIAWLHKRGFILKGAYNMSYDAKGQAVQADFMFKSNLE
jgi:FkbM family methyltransferase